MCCCKAFADGVRRITKRIVEDDVMDSGVKYPSHIDPMRRDVLDVEISHDGMIRDLNFHELTWSESFSQYATRFRLAM